MKEKSFKVLLKEASKTQSCEKLSKAIIAMEPMLSMFSNRNVYNLKSKKDTEEYYEKGYYIIPEKEMKYIPAMRDIYHKSYDKSNDYLSIESMSEANKENTFAFKDKRSTFLTLKKIMDSCVITQMINELEKIFNEA